MNLYTFEYFDVVEYGHVKAEVVAEDENSARQMLVAGGRVYVPQYGPEKLTREEILNDPELLSVKDVSKPGIIKTYDK